MKFILPEAGRTLFKRGETSGANTALQRMFKLAKRTAAGSSASTSTTGRGRADKSARFDAGSSDGARRARR